MRRFFEEFKLILIVCGEPLTEFTAATVAAGGELELLPVEEVVLELVVELEVDLLFGEVEEGAAAAAIVATTADPVLSNSSM